MAKRSYPHVSEAGTLFRHKNCSINIVTVTVVVIVSVYDPVFITSYRFTGNGWQAAEATDMMTVYNSLPAADIQRLVLYIFYILCCEILFITKNQFLFTCKAVSAAVLW